jgi:hypothetical protein
MNAIGRHCPICRDLFDEVREAGVLRHAKPFAHAHHVITGRTETARIDYLPRTRPPTTASTRTASAAQAGEGRLEPDDQKGGGRA